MKNLRTAVLCAGLALCSLGSYAQDKPAPVNEPDYNKPKLFTGLPDQVELNTEDLSNLFNAPLGRGTSLRLTDDNQFRFEGEVVSSGSKYQNNLQSMVIRSTNFNGANLTVSRVTNADGSVVYRGRIISLAHGDLYELQQRDGRYLLVKRNYYDLVNE
jgi:hypothetical protein